MPAKRTVLLEGAMTIKSAFSLSCSWTVETMTRGLSRPERTMREREEVARRERWRRRVALGAKIYRDLLLRCLFILLAAPIQRVRASLRPPRSALPPHYFIYRLSAQQQGRSRQHSQRSSLVYFWVFWLGLQESSVVIRIQTYRTSSPKTM